MADDQQFCLRWNNHQSTLISVFDTLLENGTLVDCTLAAEGQSLKAHKVVLSACSPYLETLLSEHYEKHPIIIMKDVKFTELKSMMDYMYRGEVNICQDQLGTFLKAAESLQIKGLSENGEGDARDVGSTTTRPPPPKRPPATPAARTDPEQPPAASPAHRPRDGSISPSSRKRRRTRRNSDDGDNHLDTNSCDLPLTPAQSTPVVPNIPASITSTPIRTPVVKPEINDRLDHNSLPPESGLLKEKIEPAEQLLEPKTEYLEDLNNDDSVEDLTLDDDDEMDMSQMSNMSNMSRPGPSHGTDISNQGFSPWQLGNQSGGNDEVFMAAQEAVNSHRDSQGIYIYQCDKCNKKYKYKRNLHQHVKNECGKPASNFCPYCSYKAKLSFNLYRHLRNVHNVQVVSWKQANSAVALEQGVVDIEEAVVSIEEGVVDMEEDVVTEISVVGTEETVFSIGENVIVKEEPIGRLEEHEIAAQTIVNLN